MKWIIFIKLNLWWLILVKISNDCLDTKVIYNLIVKWHIAFLVVFMMMLCDVHLSSLNVKALLGKIHFQIKIKEELNAFSKQDILLSLGVAWLSGLRYFTKSGKDYCKKPPKTMQGHYLVW